MFIARTCVLKDKEPVCKKAGDNRSSHTSSMHSYYSGPVLGFRETFLHKISKNQCEIHLVCFQNKALHNEIVPPTFLPSRGQVFLPVRCRFLIYSYNGNCQPVPRNTR